VGKDYKSKSLNFFKHQKQEISCPWENNLLYYVCFFKFLYIHKYTTSIKISKKAKTNQNYLKIVKSSLIFFLNLFFFFFQRERERDWGRALQSDFLQFDLFTDVETQDIIFHKRRQIPIHQVGVLFGHGKRSHGITHFQWQRRMLPRYI